MAGLLVVHSPEEAYDALAAVYDDFTAHHDYDGWTATLEALASQHGLHGRRLLDVGCGTGKSFMPFLERGWQVTACDLSRGMLARADKKAGGRARLVQADMRSLPADLGRFDLITCLDDAVNYLDDSGELRAAFGSMARCLAPGGLLVFDVNTLGMYRSYFAGDTCSESEGCLFVMRGEAAADMAEGEIAPATIEAFRPLGDGAWSRATSRHRQRHHPDRVVREALEASGLRCLAAHGLTTDGALHDEIDELDHGKRIYLAGPQVPVPEEGGAGCSASGERTRRSPLRSRSARATESLAEGPGAQAGA
jgi:SAM-dependent methyltransferase